MLAEIGWRNIVTEPHGATAIGNKAGEDFHKGGFACSVNTNYSNFVATLEVK